MTYADSNPSDDYVTSNVKQLSAFAFPWLHHQSPSPYVPPPQMKHPQQNSNFPPPLKFYSPTP